MWKSKPFWVCLILTLVLAAVNAIEINPEDMSWTHTTGTMILHGGSNSVLFASIFAALFLGTDYACGTIRNKLDVGHSRVDVYFSSLITVTTGTLIISAVYTLPSIFKTIVWGKELGMPTNEFLLDISILVCAMIALSAIFTLIGMLISEKSLTTTFTIILAIVMLIGSAVILQFLSHPEYIPESQITAREDLESDGMPPFVAGYVTETETTEDGSDYNLVPNPLYVTGMKRDIMTAIIDVLPGGQIIRLESNQLHNPKLYPLYSLGVIAVSTTAGVLIFRRKDLK